MPRRLDKIIWTEGMYLAPHHFQSQARYFDDSIRFTRDCFWPYGFGFLALDVDDAELSQGRFAIHHMSGVMPDGTAFELSKREWLPERQIDVIFPATGGGLKLFLALTKQRDGHCNVGTDEGAGAGTFRYHPAELEFTDVYTGIDTAVVGVLRQTFRIVAEGELSSNDSNMPIARIVRDGKGRFAQDKEFAPPCLKVATSPYLDQQLKIVLELLQESSRSLSRNRLDSLARTEVRSDPKALADFWQLHTFNSAIPVLKHWQASWSPHPAEAFRRLAELAGSLCTFAGDGDPRQLAEYDHLDPANSFDLIISKIREYSTTGITDTCVTVPLERMHAAGTRADDSFFCAAIGDRNYFENARWILAIKSEVPEALLISRIPTLVIVSSKVFVERVVRDGRHGIALTHLASPPAACPERFDWKYFNIDTRDPLFQLITSDETIGIYLPSLLGRPEIELHILVGEQPA